MTVTAKEHYLRTGEEYLKKLGTMKPNIFMAGQQLKHDDPHFLPAIKKLSLTEDLAFDPKWGKYLTTKSHLSGKTINRYTHIYQNTEDLLTMHEFTRQFMWIAGG